MTVPMVPPQGGAAEKRPGDARPFFCLHCGNPSSHGSHRAKTRSKEACKPSRSANTAPPKSSS
ncbi:protein of unknown function [Cupriavidus taiwanensis]|uniref:Uncharacterized protein n=1 Tax=Cupriavidus taiwanensis TaxID=164546 RepID=A0A375IFU6_9BURK|nr:hypothetical protein CBM2588_A60258 [Cupriavidus taiwanensis]SOY57064.1 hypothetical protein CBM2592_A90350 [Cupriavidus taiwanensis]SOY79149.1 hypothetical protein CBM2591_A100041 [Cupriavidus taiwanensis]SOZ64553.1 hypothetical protein CBM2617_A80041 [Cupriavidus taiwanensis]SOZ83271.1 hypothetical protein CBM2618_A90041 [Cupriavidus taiwanensis]